MPDAGKQFPISGGGAFISDLFSVIRTKRTVTFAYGLMCAFVLFTVFVAFNPSPNPSSPWFTNIFAAGSADSAAGTTDSYQSQFSSFFSYFFTNSSSESDKVLNLTPSLPIQTNSTGSGNAGLKSPAVGVENSTNPVPSTENPKSQSPSVNTEQKIPKNQTQTPVLDANRPVNASVVNKSPPIAKNQTQSRNGSDKVEILKQNQTAIEVPKAVPAQNQTSIEAPKAIPAPAPANITATSPGKGSKTVAEKGVSKNSTFAASLSQKQGNGSASGASAEQGIENLMKSLMNCDLFDGHWIKDDSYPLYKAGSCSLIDEQFNCILNGRPDKDFQKMKWKPRGCSIPRLNGVHMLELLRGKRLVFVGDSLNRNMWESLICILKNSAKNPKKVFESHGRSYFRGEVSYSFIFKDYNFTVEFFVSPFLVREWEVADKNGAKKETLRLDLVGKSSDQYKGADIIIFNTGHWWTHDKTAKGKDYYQEGSHIYNELNVLEAFRKALTTWSRWVDANVNPMKSMVFFRGYSASHFSGGQWNSGGACDSETEPIKNETYLSQYPSKMLVLEKVLEGMKTHVTYLNITRLTDFRKDGHPSIYRKQKLTAEERKSPLLYQDCSHWCLPGVPDSWNELLYAELLVKESKMQQHQRRVQEIDGEYR